MQSLPIHTCQCRRCQAHRPHPERALHRQINLLVSRLDEQQRRWFVALEAMRAGYGGDQRLAEITGLSAHTIRRGRRELAAGLTDCPSDRVRVAGAGRPACEAQDREITPALEALLAEETAGDPMGRRAKAKRSSLRHLSAALREAGYPASRPTVSRLLRQMGYSPKLNCRIQRVTKAASGDRIELVSVDGRVHRWFPTRFSIRQVQLAIAKYSRTITSVYQVAECPRCRSFRVSCTTAGSTERRESIVSDAQVDHELIV